MKKEIIQLLIFLIGLITGVIITILFKWNLSAPHWIKTQRNYEVWFIYPDSAKIEKYIIK